MATSGGFPSRPRLLALGVGIAAPAQAGAISSNATVNGTLSLDVDNDSNGIANAARVTISSGDSNGALFVAGSGRTSVVLTGGPTGAQTVLRTLGAHPLILGTGNTQRVAIDGATGVADFSVVPSVGGVSLPLTYGAVKTATTARASTVTMANDPHLAVALPAAGSYKYTYYLIFSGTATGAGSFKYTMAATGAGALSASSNHICRGQNGAGIFEIPVPGLLTGNTVLGSIAGTVAAPNYLWGTGIAIITGGAVTLTTQWAQQVSQADATNLILGSWIQFQRLA